MDDKKIFRLGIYGFVAVILFVLGLGVVAQFQQAHGSEVNAAVAGSAESATAFEYFPAQYVNQGKDTGEQIPTF